MTRGEIDKLERGAKWNIWFHYFLVQMSLKHNFHVRDLKPLGTNNWGGVKLIDNPDNKGWGKPDKVCHNIEIRYLWKDLNYVKFEDATTEFLHDWYLKFQKEIQL